MKSRSSEKNKLSRRKFLKCTGTIVFAIGGNIFLFSGCATKGQGVPTAVSDGYLIVDVEKCQGCVSCMLACSLVHEGAHSLTLSRIQIIQNSFEKFPNDISIEQCRQCKTPDCVEACPENALTANPNAGHVRMVDKEKCTGCGSCFDACPFTPARLLVAPDKRFGGQLKAQKCDLCANAPNHWDEKGGGPDGKQACVEVCPVGAIAFTKNLPTQEGLSGYKVNLKGKNWARLGY